MINVAQWFQFAMLESDKLYKEEMVVHSGWVVAREKLSHTGCPPSPSTPPNPMPIYLMPTELVVWMCWILRLKHDRNLILQYLHVS